ncbi:DUF3102 domain-containing protein [Parageobacillus thermoglucosidasius]|uniref:DUF3102 domain-containing protein n=1 Tax=Parageobacillus thermoglucosidasius TaxID=1426 RepID=UPI0027F2A29C|nr:hypothetical protein PthstB1num2_00250 [Parageobacillus thermoglucosidasius]
MKNEVAELSNDLNVITAEINAYKQVAGEAIFEIGRRLIHVKENDLTHGQFGKWLESIGMNWDTANRFMKIVRELGGNSDTYRNLGWQTLYLIATLPPEERDKPHIVPSTGEVKKPEDMTVRELREVKKALKEERERRERAEREAEELRNRPPKIKTARSSLAFFFVVVVIIDQYQQIRYINF